MTNPSKVLIIAMLPSGRGGMESVIRSVAQHLLNKKRLANIFFLSSSKHFQKDVFWLNGLPYQIFTYPKFFSKFFFKVQLKEYLQKNSRINTIICADPKLCKVAKEALNHSTNTLVYSWLHFSVDHFSKKSLQAITYADRHLCISSGIKEQLLSLGIKASNTYVVYNPIEPKEFTLPYTNVNNFIYVGRVEYESDKNLKELFEGMSLLKKKFYLHIIGSGNSEDIQKLKNYSTRLGIDDNIIWHGWKNQPWKYILETFDGVTALVSTSKSEGLGMSILEAISYGIPCISSNCPCGPKDIIQPTKNGYLYSPGNLSEFVTYLELTIENRSALNASEIKKTISKFYNDEYFHQIETILDNR